MNGNNNRPKRSAENHSMVHTVTSGPVLADIYRGTTPDGHAYLYYVLSRVWRPQSSVRENYSNRFYERNEMQIVEIARKASEWIRQNPSAADQHCQRRAETPPHPTGVPTPSRAPSAESRPVNGREMHSEAAQGRPRPNGPRNDVIGGTP
jgi:hypothetical protein